MYNLRRHWDLFPIKQLSPLCTLVAALSFVLLNIVSIIARALEQNQELYHYYRNYMYEKGECAQCRIYNNDAMKILALIYVGLRELPLVLFALKTLRVSVCFI